MTNLAKVYSKHIGRYTIADNPVDSASAAATKNNLELLIERTELYVIKCETDRKTARDVFSLLITDLRPFITGTEDEIKNATLFLLGALIHRYFRLIKEYENYNNSSINPVSFFRSLVQVNIWDVKNCKLYNAIADALQFIERNLGTDELTLINALEVFRHNMLLDINAAGSSSIKKARYLLYPHFAADPNFKLHLNELITEHQALGAEVVREFNAIYFMQSLATLLDLEVGPIAKELNECFLALSKDHKEFGTLTEALIKKHINSYYEDKAEKVRMKDKLLELISTGYETERFSEIKAHSDFLKVVHAINTDESRCILCGGYVLLLKKGSLSEDLLAVMKKTVGFTEELSSKDMHDCISVFQFYVEKDPAPSLNYKFFGGQSAMLTQVSQLSVTLARQIAPALMSSI